MATQLQVLRLTGSTSSKRGNQDTAPLRVEGLPHNGRCEYRRPATHALNKAAHPLKLESSVALPEDFRKRLVPFTSALKATDFVENLIRDNDTFRQISTDLDTHLATQRIWAYHCTKEASPGHFLDTGLRLTNLEEHQAEFLATHGHQFTVSEIDDMKRGWHNHFVVGRQVSIRQNRIYACLSRPLVLSHGTRLFHRYFGGEVIYFPHCNHPTIAPKLAAIGTPVVVEFAVLGSTLNCRHPMSYYVLSLYHRRLKRSAHRFDSEADFRIAVPPTDILKVTAVEQFKP